MINCKFISNGISIQYDQILRPCCTWEFDQEWANENHLDKIENIAVWHQSPQILKRKQQLDNDVWPDNCVNCAKREAARNFNNIRSNGNSAYSHYANDDITLEIRPGNVCNFACQTCWPDASSRVADFQVKAKIINRSNLNSYAITNFDFLDTIKHRIKDVVLLGGEPFYDKNCLKFLSWCRDNISANLTMFTNGSFVDFDFIEKYHGNITLVFSLDAVGMPAEYIRFGTIWNEVHENYKKCRTYSNVNIKVNITASVYNYVYLADLLKFLIDDNQQAISIGYVYEEYLQVKTIPRENRKKIIDQLFVAVSLITKSTFKQEQKIYLIRSLNVIISELKNKKFDSVNHNNLIEYIKKLDKVKNIDILNYCPEVVTYLAPAVKQN